MKEEVSPLQQCLEGFWENLWKLLGANLLFLLTVLPLITAGVGALGLEAVCLRIHRGEKVSVLREFGQAFRHRLMPGLFLSIVLLPLFLVSGLGALALVTSDRLLPMTLCMIVFLITSGILQYLLPMTVLTGLPFGRQLKNAALLIGAAPGKALAGALVSGGILVLTLWQFRLMMGLQILILPALQAYVRSFLAYRAEKKFVFYPENEK